MRLLRQAGEDPAQRGLLVARDDDGQAAGGAAGPGLARRAAVLKLFS